MIVELTITALAAGGDGVARDDTGRVTFVPRTAPGDRVRARIVEQRKSFARAELVEVLAPGERAEPPCPHFARGCGGCQWQHVTRPAQLAAKQAVVEGALRKLPGLRVHPIEDPCPPLGWRRRARFHVEHGVVGLYAEGSHRIVPIDRCPQLEPALDRAYREVVASRPPDGELAMIIGHRGDVAVGLRGPHARTWGAALDGTGILVEREAGAIEHRESSWVELEPGLTAGPWDFAQASAAGNRALVARSAAALGPGPGRLLELHAGTGNLTRAYRANGWDVMATDAARGAEIIATAADALARPGRFDAIALDPPRTGAAEAIAGVLAHAPRVIVYVSCDPATLARDAERLAGYAATDAWPIDLMPQTSHVEVVLRLQRA